MQFKPLSASVALIQKPVNWFARATLALNGLSLPLTGFDTRTTRQCVRTLPRPYWLENLKEQVSPCKVQILCWVLQYSFFPFNDSGFILCLKPKTLLEKHNLISMFFNHFSPVHSIKKPVICLLCKSNDCFLYET